MTPLIILNEELTDIMKSLEESGLLIKGVFEKLNMKQTNKKKDFNYCY